MEFQVSVIIPVYNAAPFLREAVHTALDQPEVGEVLLVEDGSVDGSFEVCQSLAESHPKVRVLHHEGRANRGAGASRNLGIAHASLPFIAFLDADDTYAPDRFRKAADILTRRPDCEGVYEATGLMPTTLDHQKPALTTVCKPLTGDDLFFALSPLGRAGYFSVVALTVRNTVFAKAGTFSEVLTVSQDTDWMLRLAATCRLCPGQIDAPVSLRRIHAGNRSTDEAAMRPRKAEMALACLTWCADHRVSGDKQEEILRLYLKYRFEAVHLFGKGNRWQRKWRDVVDGMYLWYRFPELRGTPFMQYHLRMAFKLPVTQHLNYYEQR